MEPKVILDKTLIDKIVKEEKMEFSEQIEVNPWNVSTLDSFLYYHCPECDVNFRHDTKDSFLTHATDQHPKSHEFLSNFLSKEEDDQMPNGINEFDETDIFEDDYINSEYLNGLDEHETEEIKVEPDTKPFKKENFRSEGEEESDADYEPGPKKGKFQCEICNKTFKNSSTLGRHKREKHPPKPEDFLVTTKQENEEQDQAYKCAHCDKIMYSRISWQSHMKTHKRKRGRKAQFLKEVEPESGLEKYRCDKCDTWFDSFASFRTHSKYHGFDQNERSLCILCQKEFDHVALLMSHMLKDHVTNGEYKCDFCTKTFRTDRRQMLEFHVTKEHGIGDFKFKCDICDMPFPRGHSLKKHISVVHEKKSLNLICDTCGLVCKTKTHLTTHVKANHAGSLITDKDINKKCDKCQVEFNDPQIFEDHLKQCLDENDKKDFKCKHCDLHWVSHLSLEMHIVVSHQKIHYVCRHCGHTTSQLTSLNYHIKTKHDKIYDFVCHICPKSYARNEELKEHLASSHKIGELKHKCAHCEYSFYTKGRLSNHIKNKHTKDTIYHCDQCPKQFWAKEYLRHHVRIVHQKWRPNKCDICTEAFLYKRDLIKHKTNVHHC